jgi:dTDP-glucose 4,6-dehydratase/UDP-glucose 4-epimerase
VKVLVTGGLGFIGRGLSAAFVDRGDEVAILDNGWRSDLDPPIGVSTVIADVRDVDAVSEAVKSSEIVVHLAAIQGTANFYEQPELVLDVNVRGALNIADACATHDVRRLIFSSSSEVYGIPTRFPTTETEPLSVPDPLNPRWSYGGSKILGELAVANLARNAGFEFAILRYHNVYGPDMGWDHVIPQFIRRLELGEEFTVQGDGEQQRAFCYVDDAVAATVAAAVAPAAAGGIFNVGNPGGEISINGLIGLLAHVSGKEIRPRYEPFAGEGTRRRLPDITRAREVLGFEPRVTLEDGLRRTYDWYAAALR